MNLNKKKKKSLGRTSVHLVTAFSKKRDVSDSCGSLRNCVAERPGSSSPRLKS